MFFLQVQSCFQQSWGGGHWHLLMSCHPHWWCFIQLHSLWGRYVTKRTENKEDHLSRRKCNKMTSVFAFWPAFIILFLLSLSELKRLLVISHDHKFPSKCINIACHHCCLEVYHGSDWFFELALTLSTSSSLQTSYSPEVGVGCGAAGEGESSLLAAGGEDLS